MLTILLIFQLVKFSIGFKMLQGKIQGQSSDKIYFQYSGISTSTDSYSLQIYTKSNANSQYVLLQQMSYNMSQKISIQFYLWNIEQISLNFLINFTSETNSSLTNIFDKNNPIHTAAFIKIQIVQDKISQFHFISIILQKDLSNVMLPFNLINPKTSKVFITILNNNLTTTSYNTQPFQHTFWNEYGYSATALPWIPFLSQCTIQASRIMTGQLLYPDQCSITYPFTIQVFSCQNKLIEFQCLMQQQNVQNPKNYPWYNTYTDPLFYLYPSMIINDQLKDFINDKSKISSFTSTVNQLIPMKLINNAGINAIPNIITVTFGVQIGWIDQIDIVYASVTLDSINNQNVNKVYSSQQLTKVLIQVQYLNFFDSFYYLAAGSQFYAILAPLVLIFVFILKKICDCFQIQLRLQKKVFICFNKILKGFLLFSICSLAFIFSFYYMNKLTYFDGISTSFNSDSAPQTQIYSGRSGLIVIICGIYLLSSGINQAFKIDSENQIKIYIEDELQQKKDNYQQSKNKLQLPDMISQQEIFIRQNLNSKRKYLLILMLLFTTFLSLLQYQIIKFNYKFVAIFLLIFQPLLQKCLWLFLKFCCLQQMLYSFIILIALQTTTIFYFMLATTIFELFILNIASLLGSLLVHFALQLFFEQIIVNLKYSNGNRIKQRIYEFFQEYIDASCQQSLYQRSLTYSSILHSKLVGLYLQPLFFLLLYCTIDQNQIYKKLFVNKTNLLNIAILELSFFFLHIFLLFLVQVLLQNKFKLKISQTVQYGGFKFKKRSIRWMNDIFHQNSSISFFYREFQKFNFSSQLYLVSFIVAFSICTITVAIRMIISTSYIMFADPILMFFLFLIWLCGDFMSIIISFLVIKLKLYENKQKNYSKSKLKNLQKILKNDQSAQYLQLDRVKDYFMVLNKEWIINKIQKLLEKEDKKYDSRFLKVYNYYKSYLKKCQVEQRRGPRNSIVGSNSLLKKLNTLKFTPSIFKIQMKMFQQSVKPLIYRWFYTAKQNCYLRSIVQPLKKLNIKEYCQFCQIDINLQVVEQVNLLEILNKYRVVNVQNNFIPSRFFEFYKQQQKFSTVCFQCKQKKVYLQKSELKNIEISKRLVWKWLIISRGKILHKKQSS